MRALLNSSQTTSFLSLLSAGDSLSPTVSSFPPCDPLFTLSSLFHLRFFYTDSSREAGQESPMAFLPVSKQKHLALLRAQLLCLSNPVGKRGTGTERPSALLQLCGLGHRQGERERSSFGRERLTSLLVKQISSLCIFNFSSVFVVFLLCFFAFSLEPPSQRVWSWREN